MKTYLAVFLLAAFAAGVLTPLLRRVCERYKLLDASFDNRRVHQRAVPRLGGIAIFFAVMIALSSLALVHNLASQSIRVELKSVVSVLGCGCLVLLLGIYDDTKGANAWVKLLVLGGITALFYAIGGRIEGLSVPFFGPLNVPPVAGFALTLLWMVGITNAFNLIDGVDGLATGSALFSSFVLVASSLIQGNTWVALVALALSGALAAFLRYNFNPASIFLGDSGSLFVGFTLAALSLQGSQKASTAVAVAIPILAFGLPVVDSGVTIARRLLSGKPIFKGDREHIHHMLLARGWSQRRVALALYAVSAAFGLAAMLLVNSGSALPAVVLFVIGTATVLALGHLRYHEVDELRASVRRNISDRRLRAINNLRIRRACQSLASANDLNQFFDAVVEVAEAGEFDSALAALSYHEHVMVNAWALEIAQGADRDHDLRLFDGRVHWNWKQRASSPDPCGAPELWTIQLPISNFAGVHGHLDLSRSLSSEPLLFDVSYLTNVFQPAVTEAAQRIFDRAAESMPRQRHATAR